MKTGWMALVFMMALLLAGCSNDPRNLADAYAATSRADQDASDRKQERAQAESMFAVENNEAELTSAARVQARIRFTNWVSITGSISLSALIVCAAIGFGWASIGTGRAVARYAGRRADVLANLVPLSVKTRQYPLILQRMAGQLPLYTMANPNTGEVLQLDLRRDADRQMIAACHSVQFAGMVAMEAARSAQADALAMIKPPMIVNELFWKGEDHDYTQAGA